jgi:O-antigen/teichoic acid export membrane protein
MAHPARPQAEGQALKNSTQNERMLNKSQESGSLTAHVSWLMLAKTAAFVFNLVLPFLLVRRLDLLQFGVYKQLFLIIGTLVTLLPLGFSMSAYYFLPRERDRQGEVVLNILIFNAACGILACGAFLLWPALLDAIFHQPELTGYAPLVGLVILLWIVASALDTIPIAQGEMKLASIMIMGIQLSRTIIYLLAAIVFGTVRSLMYAAVAQGVMQTAVLWWYLQSRYGSFWRRFDGSLLRSQLSYSMPLGLVGVLYIVQTDLHNYVVSYRLGAVAFAIYAVGTVQQPLVGMLQEATNAVMIPRVAAMQQANDSEEIIFLLARATRKLAAVYFPIYALLMVVAREFISFLFTPRFLPSLPVFRINLTLLLPAVLLQDPLFRAYMGQRLFLVRLGVMICALLAGLLWLGTSYFGILGAISAVVIVRLIDRTISAVRFGGILGVGRRHLVLLKDLGKLALAAAVASLLTAGVRLLFLHARPLIVLLICGVVFSLIYLDGVLLSGVLTAEERDLVRRKMAILFPKAQWLAAK